MEYTANVICPECGQVDSTLITLDTTELFYTTLCEHCENPYAFCVQIEVRPVPYKLVKAE